MMVNDTDKVVGTFAVKTVTAGHDGWPADMEPFDDGHDGGSGMPPADGPRYVKTRMIQTCVLVPHPDALAFGAAIEDRVALSSSVAEVGLLDPISVVENGETYWVLDGCGRLDAIRATGADEALCTVFDLNGMSPREFAMQRNTMQRKVTTGQRLMCYLSVNRTAVLKASERGAGRPLVLELAGLGDPDYRKKKQLRSRDRNLREYCSRAVSERLGISDKAVRAGVDLLKAETEFADADADDGSARALREVMERVMGGATPIRRWRPAWEGIMKTKGGERAPVNHGALARRALVSLRTGFTNWQEIPVPGQVVLLEMLRGVLKMAPESAESYIFEAAEALKAAREKKTRRANRRDEEV